MTAVLGPSLDHGSVSLPVAPDAQRPVHPDARDTRAQGGPAPPVAASARVDGRAGALAVLRHRIAELHQRIAHAQQVDDRLATLGRRATRMQDLANEVVIRRPTPEETIALDEEYTRVGATLLEDLAGLAVEDRRLYKPDDPLAPPQMTDIVEIRLRDLPPEALDRITRAISDILMHRLEVRRSIRRMAREADSLHGSAEQLTGGSGRVPSARAAAEAAAGVSRQIAACPDAPPARAADPDTALALLYSRR